MTAAVTAAGYDGYVEVEIFNASVWDAPADETAATVRERFAAVFGGRLARRAVSYNLTIASGGASLIPARPASLASALAQRSCPAP